MNVHNGTLLTMVAGYTRDALLTQCGKHAQCVREIVPMTTNDPQAIVWRLPSHICLHHPLIQATYLRRRIFPAF